MRRTAIIAATFATIALPAGTLAASAPPETPPMTEGTAETVPAASATEPIATETMAPVTEPAPPASGAASPAAGGPIPVFDDSGNQRAVITVVSIEPGWTDYPEGEEPEAGREYLRVTVSVESQVPDGTFNVNVDHFILQDNNGFVTDAENIKTAAQDQADEDVVGEADLANGESVELALTFEFVSSVGPQSVFYAPDDDRLVDVVDI